MKKLTLILLFSIATIYSWADDSGTCGENLTWTYVESTQTLTISGTGEMTNYGPWYSKIYRSQIAIVVIKKSVTSIGSYAFREFTGLTSITIPNSVTTIGRSAFSGCTGLTSITIPNSVTAIGWYSFQNCTGLNEIIIPNSVTAIGGGAFEGTAWYDNQSDEMVYAGNVAYKYKGTMPANTQIQLKEGTTGISGSAFSGCTGLTSIEIPNSVTSIGESAFEGCI
ncbi:MAG: leucine-rich repeat domain-containing protein [Bacteroidaceae bacterium]|nr:leucine-rich repeat domain-containing protein [Bacteroidaceae bacterium]